MITAPHVIGMHSILIAMEREEGAAAILQTASDLWPTRLAPEAEAVFSAALTAGERVRIERLELDLGTIGAGDFAFEFPLRFRRALAAELRRQLAGREQAGGRAGDRDTVARASPLAVLEHLLLHGMLPWWAPDDPDFDPPRALGAALDETPGEVAALARRIGRHARVRFRMVRWLSDAEIALLIRAVARGDAEFVLRYAADLEARQEEERFVAAGAVEFRHAKWEIILGHLLADRGSRFNAKSFLRQTLRELAGRFRVDYADLLRELAGAAARAGLVWREASLPLLLGEIFAEDVLHRPGTMDRRELAEAAEGTISAISDGDDTAGWEDAAVRGDDATRPGRSKFAAWLAAWRDELQRPPGEWPRRDRELEFWRELPAGEGAEILALLVREHGAESVANRLAVRFSPVERTRLVQIVRVARGLRGERGTAAILRGTEAARGLEQVTRLLHEVGAEGEAGEGGFETPWWSRRAAMQALKHFLFTGALPATRAARRWHGRAEAWLVHLLAAHAVTVPSWLRTWNRSGDLAAAMSERLGEPMLEAVVDTVEPDHAEEVIELVRTAQRVKSEPGEVPIGADALRRSTWRIVLDYLLSDRGSVFNRRAFLRASIAGFAARHGLAWARALELIGAAARSEGRHALVQDLQWLAAEQRVRAAQTAADPAGDEVGDPAGRGGARYFRAETVRRSPLVRLRLLRLIAGGAPLAATAGIRALLPQLWETLAAEPADAPGRAWLRASAHEPAVVDRLLASGGENALAAVFFSGEPAQAEQWQESVAWLENSAGAAALFPGGRADLRRRLWRALAAVWREECGRPIRDVAAWLAAILARIRGERARPGVPETQPLLDALRAASAADTSREARRLRSRLPAPDDRRGGAARKRRKPPEPERSPEAEVPVETKAAATREPEPAEKPAEPTSIANAGLVLLAPFFSALFRRCGWLDEEGLFADFSGAQRAVHLLQFLAGERGRSREHSLVLNKVLCGLDPWVAAVEHVDLAPEEQEAARELLEHVAARWPRGAAISPEGIRSSYLWRPGLLRRRDEAWALQVERRGWDFFLPELPWSFAVIRPAWMPEPLHVDWI